MAVTYWQGGKRITKIWKEGKGNLWKCEDTWYLSLFYTTAIWGQEILHLKVRKFATKLNVKFFTLCNFYTVCKAIFRVPIWLTTSGCNGRNKYQVWMWNEIFIFLSCGSKNPIGHPTTQEFILMGDFLKTLQELRMLSRSLSDCKSLLFNVMIQVLQFVSNSQLCH